MSTIFVAIIAATAVAGESPRWPAFLGAGASPIDAQKVPAEWSPEKNLAWKQPLPGYGQSSPVIFNDRIFVTSVDGKSKESLIVTAYQLSDGKQLWSHQADSQFPEKNTVYISRAAPTPVVDGKHVYAYFESGDVLALTHDGETAWARSLTKDFGKPTNEFGLSASPVQTADHVIILIDDPGKSYLVALSKTDGAVAWKTDRSARTSWSSPGLIEVDGTQQVVCSSAGSVDGYDAANGKRLWTFDEIGGNSATSPTDLGEGRFLVAASPGRRGENAELAKQSNGMMTVTRDSDAETGWKVAFQWVAKSATPSWASPVLHQGHAYWVNRVGALFCIDAQSGETAYTARVKQSAWATPVGIGDYIYLFGKSGTTSIVAAGPEFKVVAENSLWSDDAPPINNLPTTEETSPERRRASAMFSQPVLYGVAIVDGSIVMRTGSMLFCVRKE